MIHAWHTEFRPSEDAVNLQFDDGDLHVSGNFDPADAARLADDLRDAVPGRVLREMEEMEGDG